MRWLLEWLLLGTGGGLLPEGRLLARLRSGATRLRLRSDYHRRQRDEAREAFDRANRRIQLLEMSEDAAVEELVEARKALLWARDSVEHHEAQLRTTEHLRRLIRVDRAHLAGGRDPEHWEAYACELDA